MLTSAPGALVNIIVSIVLPLRNEQGLQNLVFLGNSSFIAALERKVSASKLSLIKWCSDKYVTHLRIESLILSDS